MRFKEKLHANVAKLDELEIIESDDEDLYTFADVAYARYVEWFGPPKNPERPYKIKGGPYSGIGYDMFAREYVIVINKKYEYYEQCFATLAHEMYHRVTKHHRGLRQLLWVDEMMAEVSTRQLLCEQGYTDYADLRLQVDRQKVKQLNVSALKNAQRRRVLLGLRGFAYPEGFAEGVSLLGATLEKIVGWEQMCRLIHCQTWDEWLVILPDDVRLQVCRLLGLC